MPALYHEQFLAPRIRRNARSPCLRGIYIWRCRETSDEAVVIIQARNDQDSDQDSSPGGGEKWSGSEYVLEEHQDQDQIKSWV